MGKLTKFIGIVCAAILACSVQVSAKTVINETFDNTTVSGVMGAGKLFTSGTSASTSDVSIEAEANGNKYFQLKQSSSQKVLLTSSGIMDDVTTISARMKFNGGNTTGLILRNGSNQFYIAVNNGGGSVLRLFNNASTALTIDYNKWYDVFYKIDFNANTIYGSIKPVGSVSGVENTVALNSAVTKNSHIRIISDGTASAPSKGVCIDKLIVGDRYEPSYFVNETFDNYSTGNVTSASFAPEAGFSLTATSFFANTSIVESEQGKSLKVTGTKNIAEPLVYTMLVPNGKSILSFDAKASELTNEFRAFIQTNASNRLNIMQFYNSTDSSVADFVSVLGHQDKYLGEKIKSEFVNFTYVIEKGNGQTTISGYVNGEYFGTKTLGVDYTSVRFDLNAGGIPQGVDGTKSVMYLDNYKFYQPGATEVSVEIPEYITNGDYVTLKANNFINPDTLSFNCPEGVTITPETVDGKEYKLVFDGLRKNQNYTITAGNICDLYGQSFSVPAISFESIPAPLVEAEASYKFDGMPCLNGKFAPGKLDVAFTAMSNTDADIKTIGYIALYGEDEKVLLGVKAVDIVVPARGSVTIPADITISDDVKKVGVFVWYEDMSPVCDADVLLPYTYDEIESVEVYYPGHTNKAVTFSYDDGIFGTDEILINLFNKYNLKGTFNIVGSFIPEDEAELAKYQALYEGHEIANHSMTHPKVNVESEGVTIQMATDDILACREKLESVFGDAFDSDKWGFVWPYARPVGRNPETDIPFVTQLEQNIKNMGAVYIRPVTTTGNFDLPSDWMLWEPTSKDDNMEEYTDAFLADSENGLRLLYLWGHSTDLSSKKYGKGFADLEATFKKLTAEGVNIWSATNMEIYDYIHAATDIKVSEDKTKVINSSDVDVYAVINGQKVVIPANGYTAL